MNVTVTPHVRLELSKLPNTIQLRVFDVIERLKRWPEVSGVKWLKEDWKHYARVRTGDYRVIFKLPAMMKSKSCGSPTGATPTRTNGAMTMTKLTMEGRGFVLVPEKNYEDLVARLGEKLPPLPPPDKDGNFPAGETILAMIARDVIGRRVAAGWSQRDLATSAGVTLEGVRKLESAKQRPATADVNKIEKALKKAGV